MELHIGKEIRRVLEEKGRSGKWLAQKINTSSRNLYDILNRDRVSTGQLSEISKALDFNFFALYQKAHNNIVNEAETLYTTPTPKKDNSIVIMVELDGLETTLDLLYNRLKKINAAI